jgi:hypothetical protein
MSLAALPVAPATVGLYLAELACHLSVATFGCRPAPIATPHRLLGHEKLGKSPVLTAVHTISQESISRDRPARLRKYRCRHNTSAQAAGDRRQAIHQPVQRSPGSSPGSPAGNRGGIAAPNTNWDTQASSPLSRLRGGRRRFDRPLRSSCSYQPSAQASRSISSDQRSAGPRVGSTS